MDNQTPHLSPSSINQFLRCQAQWYYRYQRNVVLPPSGALTQGTCFDRACQAQFVERIANERDLRIQDVLGAFEAEWDIQKEATDWKEDSPAALKDQGIGITQEYYGHGLVEIEPTSFQDKFEIDFEGDIPQLVGYIDVIHASKKIIDQKTTARMSSTLNPEHKVQMIIYALGGKTKYKHEFDCELHYAVKTKTPKIEKVALDITGDVIDFHLRQLARVAGQIANLKDNPDLILPNRNHPWACSEKFCGYWKLCHSEF